jgi:1-acyl-sn-glycerol-3-phosphate acyltransferase
MVWHALKVVRGALIFTAFYLSGALFGSAFLAFFWLLGRNKVDRMRSAHFACGTVFRFVLSCLRWCRIFTFDARTVLPQLPEKPVIVIANHPTTIDVVAVLSVYREAAVVVKHKIWTDPFLGRMFNWVGHIPGGDGSAEANATMLAQVQERLNQGFSVVIFPEGTRSPAGGLGTMYRGAFSVACATQTDILPVLITCDPPALHKDAPWHALPKQPVDYQLHPQHVVSVAGLSARQLQREVTALYRGWLGLPSPTASEDSDKAPSAPARPAAFAAPSAERIASSG